jgi:hypothetical protein
VGARTDRLILIVVGAHLHAEVGDRPVAYALRQKLLNWLEERGLGGEEGRPVIVCSDLWYLNTPELAGLPTVSIGGPGVNALSAHWANKVPNALAVENFYVVQMDVEGDDSMASCWGVDSNATAAAAEAFAARYLDLFMRGATQRW